MICGDEFVRQVRTNVEEEAGLRRADAVYTVSPALPDGLRTFAADVADSCAENGIPTI